MQISHDVKEVVSYKYE